MARKIKIDNSELKRRQYKKRSHIKKEIICHILIVCEGSKTEPNYFKSFNKTKQGAIVFDLEFEGGGISTTKVVEKALELKKIAIQNKKPYDRIWAVFDRDSFSEQKFNAAIQMAQSNDIGCAWSNEAFELWYLLHFYDRITHMRREEYQKAISNAVNGSSKYKSNKEYKYTKNAEDNFFIMNKYGNQADAIKRAIDLECNYDDHSYAKHNPCTSVYKLINQLIGKDSELNEELMKKINE